MTTATRPKASSFSIDLPEISMLLIIGDSPTAFAFSKSLQNIALFDQIFHVESIFSAVRLFQNIRFAVIVIDSDSDFDVVSCSKIINLSNELTRIVLISKGMSVEDTITLKNKGFIHAFIPIPCGDMLAHTLIVKEQATYRIHKSLIDMIINPPPNTPLSNLIKQQSPVHLIRPHRILGIVIMEDTIVKYNLFFDYDDNVDPYLLSSYLSAISMYGKQIFDVKVGEFEGLLFDKISILMKTLDNFQYIYLVENLSESKLSEVQKFLRVTTRKIHLKYNFMLTSQETVTQGMWDNMLIDIKKQLKMEHRDFNILESDNKPLIISLDLPNEIFSQVEDETSRVYRIEQVASEFQLFDLLKDSECDVVVLNDVENLENQKPIIANIKTISPSTQIIVSACRVDETFTFEILNMDDVKYVLLPNMRLDEYFTLIKKGIEHSRRIRNAVYVEDLYEFYVSNNQTEMIKTLLSKIPHSLDTMSHPELYGLFIIKGEKKFYSSYWVKDSSFPMTNEESFLSFMEALLSFSEDIAESAIALSLINFGESKLVLDKMEEYWFVYFVGNLDISNYDFTKEKTRELTTQIHDIIMGTEHIQQEFSGAEYRESIELQDEMINQICIDSSLILQ